MRNLNSFFVCCFLSLCLFISMDSQAQQGSHKNLCPQKIELLTNQLLSTKEFSDRQSTVNNRLADCNQKLSQYDINVDQKWPIIEFYTLLVNLTSVNCKGDIDDQVDKIVFLETNQGQSQVVSEEESATQSTKNTDQTKNQLTDLINAYCDHKNSQDKH